MGTLAITKPAHRNRILLAPLWAVRGLRKFGLNPYGQPNFRVVWGPSRWYIAGGYWADVGRSEYRKLPKYGLDPKWVLERWRPASVYGNPWSWEHDTVTPDGFLGVGPFPVHGEYENVTTFSTEKGEQGYVPLEPGLVELTARLCWMGRIATYSDLKRMHEDEELRKEREQDGNFDAMWEEKQLSRPGLTIGAAGAFNKQQEIDDYARRIERAGAFVDARRFKAGFRQQG